MTEIQLLEKIDELHRQFTDLDTESLYSNNDACNSIKLEISKYYQKLRAIKTLTDSDIVNVSFIVD